MRLGLLNDGTGLKWRGGYDEEWGWLLMEEHWEIVVLDDGYLVELEQVWWLLLA